MLVLVPSCHHRLRFPVLLVVDFVQKKQPRMISPRPKKEVKMRSSSSSLHVSILHCRDVNHITFTVDEFRQSHVPEQFSPAGADSLHVLGDRPLQTSPCNMDPVRSCLIFRLQLLVT